MADIIFWIFMLVMNLLVPATMIFLGRMFLKAAPKNINYAFGYRTSRSMKNKDTWTFAHKCIGRLWHSWGIVIGAISLICVLLLFGRDTATVGYASLGLMAVQLVFLLVPCFIVEGRLKETFDKNGYRRYPE